MDPLLRAWSPAGLGVAEKPLLYGSPPVFLWESLGEEGREECEQAIRTRKDWVVWSRARPCAEIT